MHGEVLDGALYSSLWRLYHNIYFLLPTWHLFFLPISCVAINTNPGQTSSPNSAQAVLAERSCCPFTKQPLTWEQCKVLTKNNIHLYRDRIIK